MPITLVLNSYYFVEDVIPGTLQELAGEEGESQLFKAISRNGHRMLITDRGAGVSIKREYETEAIKRGLGPQLVVVLDQLTAQRVAITPNVPRRPIPNLRGSHKIFIEDAVAAGVEYFLTEYGPWRRLDRDRRLCPNLRIVTARQFVRAVRATDL